MIDNRLNLAYFPFSSTIILNMSYIMKKIRIGTRGSKLAMNQAQMVKEKLLLHHSHIEEVTLHPIITQGDKVLNVPVSLFGGKGLFTKEIEEALLRNEIDMAVHSMKDVAVKLPAGLIMACILEREDPRDAYLLRDPFTCFEDLPQGAVVGTSSLRRGGQLLDYRPDLTIQPFRGNVESRIKKLNEKQVDVTLLAVAGLKRLEKQSNLYHIMDINQMLPAAGQGAIGVEIRHEDSELGALLAPINHPKTAFEVDIERYLLEKVEGGCTLPFAAYCYQIAEDRWCIESWKAVVHKPSIRLKREFIPSLWFSTLQELAKELQAYT